MKTFKTWDDIQIAYQEWGGATASSPPVVLHHGFVADANANWVAPGVVDALVAGERHVVAPDARGHGRSEKPHDPSRYGEQLMARDLAGPLAVRPEVLVAALPSATLKLVSGNHMAAVADPQFAQAIVEFVALGDQADG